MATCKECLHNEMCYATHIDDSPACCDFKDCSKYVVREKGEWVTHSDRPDSLICSVCKCGFDMWKHDPHNYCPNCGADMRKGENG